LVTGDGGIEMMDIVMENKSTVIKWIATIMIGTVLLLLPTNETLTPEIKKYLFVTIVGILSVAFELIPVLATALLIPAGYYLLGVATIGEALAGYTNINFFMVFGAFLFAFTMMESGFLDRVALWGIIHIGKGNFTRTMYAMVFVGMVIGFITLNSQQMILITLAMGIIAAMKKDVGIESALLMNTTALGYLTVRLAMYFPLQHALLSSGGISVDPNFAIEWADPLIYGWIFLPATFFIVFVYSLIYKTKNFTFGEGLGYLNEELHKKGAMSKKEKKAAVYMIVIMILIATGSLTGIAASKIFICVPFIAFLPGINLANAKTFNRIPWGTLLLVPACLAFGSLGTKLGLGELLQATFMPLLEGTNAFGFLGVVFLLSTILDFVLTPLAILTLLATPVAQMGASLGIDPMASMLTLYYSVEAIFMPHESTGYLLMYSFGMMKMKDFIALQGIKSVLIFIVFIALVIPYWMMMGLL